jgi:integrase/recombinase XerD
MAKKRSRKQQPQAPINDPSDYRSMEHLISEHVLALRVRNFSEETVLQREKYLRWFAKWCSERSLTRPTEITKPILERYQRHLYQYRNEKDQPMSFRSQYAHLSHIRAWYKWLAKENHVLTNPASDLDLPKLGKSLPKAVLTAEEAERVINQPDTTEAYGIRDRAILEVLYSTGIRRRELANLQLFDIDASRRTLTVRQGKGKKDRIVPIGKRALQWIDRYLNESRPHLLASITNHTLFLSNLGTPLDPDSLTEYVRQYVERSKIGKKGSCHMFRHTMATLMLENGADVRYIQAMLGHAQLSTTEIYTRVSIRKLQQVHELTHPADNPKDAEGDETKTESRSDAKPLSSEESQA